MRLFSLCAIVRHAPFQEKRPGRDKGIGVSVLPHQLHIIDIAAAGKVPRIVRPEHEEALRPFLPDTCSSVLVRTGFSSARFCFSVNVSSSRFPGMKGSPVTRSQMTRRIFAESPLTRRIRFCTTEKLISIPPVPAAAVPWHPACGGHVLPGLPPGTAVPPSSAA